MSESLSSRVFAAAMAMHELYPQMVHPRLEDFTHLDIPVATRPPPAEQSATDPKLDERVRAVVHQMQDSLGVSFGDRGA